MNRRAHPFLRYALCASLLMLTLALGTARAQSAETLLTRLNTYRTAQALLPLYVSAELNEAAQRHSRDLAALGDLQHGGSDGSRPDQRATEAGYTAYADAGAYISENLYRGTSVDDALDWWLDDAASLRNLTNTDVREMGVGVAQDDAGQVYVVLLVGARPNSLPVFINGDASETGSAEVTLALSNETVEPAGREGVIGRVSEVRVSNSPGFAGATWQAWAPSLAWTVSAGMGQKTVYVQFRDAQGRLTAATDSIMLTADAPTAVASPVVAGTPASAPTTRAVSPTAPPATRPRDTATPPPLTPTPNASAPVPTNTTPAEPPVPAETLALVCLLQAGATLMTAYVVLRRQPPAPHA